MSTAVLRPNATLGNSGTVTGASAHAALSDDSAASYIDYPTSGHLSQLSLGTFSIPAGAVAKSVSVRLRQRYTTPSLTWTVQLYDPASLLVYLRAVSLATNVLTTVSSVNAIRSFTQAEIDSMSMTIERDGGPGNGQVHEAYADLVYVTQPVVSVTAPTGTITDTNRPTVGWSNVLDSDGGAQTHYEVRIFSAAQYGIGGFDPATSPVSDASGQIASSSASYQAQAILADATYRAYVRTAQTVNGAQHWSAWDFEGFTIDVALPGVPDLAVTAQSGAGRIQVDVEATAGAATTDAIEVQRSVDGGETWEPLRNIHGDDGYLFTTMTGTTFDYETPNGVQARYRARASHAFSGLYVATDWSAEVTATWQSTQWWLKHPTRPALNLPIEIASYREVTRAARQTAFQAMGADLPVVISDSTRGGPVGTVVLTAYDSDEQDALNALLDTTDTLLLHGPVEDGMPDRYVRIGDQASSRVVDKSFAHVTTETLPWVEVAVPGGAQTGDQYTAPEDDGEDLVIG